MSKSTDTNLTTYYQDAASWELDKHRSDKRSKAVAWFLAMITSALLCVALLALFLLVPLKSFEPYLVVVDKNTGYIEVKSVRDTDFDALSLTERQAVTQANIVRFIRNREGYDPMMIEENFGIAALLSTADASRELQELYSATNQKNPTKLYGKNKRVRVDIKSVTFLNESAASVRFSAEEKSDTEQTVKHYVAIVRFRYTSQPSTNTWKFENPLGFQVYGYRRDQETVAAGSDR